MLPGGTDVSGVQAEAVEAQDVGTDTVIESAESSSEDVIVDPVTDTSAKTEVPAKETARQTVERIFRESKAEDGSKDAEAEPEKEAEPSKEAKTVTAKKATKTAASKTESFTIPAPSRLTVDQKEAFYQLPDNLKRATHRMFQDWEAQYTKSMQETVKAGREAQHVVEAVRPYLLAHPELAERGFTESKLAASLIAAHQKLTDPKTARETWLELGATPQIGVPKEVLESLQEQLLTPGSGAGDISKHPQFVALQEKLNAITSKIDSAEKTQFNATVSSTVAEMEAVREEKDASGKFLYPELHDNAFLERVKPLVSALVATIPDLGYGEALKRAYHTVKGNGNSTQVNQARFPANNEQLARAQQAAVSVRGRSAPISAGGVVTDIPKEALGSARDSVRWALNQLRRGA
jgi:hypothetical protein